MKGFIIGDYKFEKPRIGRGAFSNIYKGKHIHTNLPVAVKEMPYEKIKKIKENIKREFTLLKTLDHPNIIRLYDVFFDESSKNIYFMIDLHEMGDLSSHLKNKKIKEKYAKNYMRQIKDGLEYLYNQKILHRDLKPQNILVSKDNRLIITDFGFARYFESDMLLQTICGSPLYMAPEILLKKKYSIISDLWSVGIIMFEILFAKLPFDSKNLVELIHKIKKKEVIIPKDPTISNHAEDLLLKLLKKDPSKRCNWDTFFTHIWFNTDELLEDENKLLEISLSNNSSLPNLFKHTSIRESLQSSDKSVIKTQSNESNISEVIDNETDVLFDMSMEEEYTDEIHSKNNDIDLSTDSFISLENECEDIHRSFLKEPSSPIVINYSKYNLKNQSTIYITQDMIHKESDNECEANSLSESIKKYLKSSITFLKESYKYISHGNTI